MKYSADTLTVVGELFYSFILQMFLSIGIVILFGFVIAYLNKKFYQLVGKQSLIICYVTGFLGTPVHELGHAIMCVIFGHKIKEIKLFQINSEDGVMGYVRHSHNTRNIYQRIGCFFVGIGPLVFGSAVMLLLAYILTKDMVYQIIDSIMQNSGNILMGTWETVKIFFSYYNNIYWWVFLVLGISIALHMKLSKADIKNSKPGLLMYAVFLFVADFILWAISGELLQRVNEGFIVFGYYQFFLMLFSVVFSLFFLAIGAIIHSIKQSRRRR